ncbi:hypothetical protein ABEB36_009555 [Hypothenemus hampei]|uniref:MADF domain-containing protein n=1 Tax=Hypothenemus hampei TaxID=57062 RepID=A0ABD1EGY6_HYPHA
MFGKHICNREQIQQFADVTGRERKWTELRSAYQRWKVAAKKNVTADKKKGSTTGGGPQEIKASELDYLINDISPDDFVEDRNHFDSNGVEEISPKETGTPSGCSSLIGLSSSLSIFHENESTGELNLMEKKASVRNDEAVVVTSNQELTNIEKFK